MLCAGNDKLSVGTTRPDKVRAVCAERLFHARAVIASETSAMRTRDNGSCLVARLVTSLCPPKFIQCSTWPVETFIIIYGSDDLLKNGSWRRYDCAEHT